MEKEGVKGGGVNFEKNVMHRKRSWGGKVVLIFRQKPGRIIRYLDAESSKKENKKETKKGKKLKGDLMSSWGEKNRVPQWNKPTGKVLGGNAVQGKLSGREEETGKKKKSSATPTG